MPCNANLLFWTRKRSLSGLKRSGEMTRRTKMRTTFRLKMCNTNASVWSTKTHGTNSGVSMIRGMTLVTDPWTVITQLRHSLLKNPTVALSLNVTEKTRYFVYRKSAGTWRGLSPKCNAHVWSFTTRTSRRASLDFRLTLPMSRYTNDGNVVS